MIEKVRIGKVTHILWKGPVWYYLDNKGVFRKSDNAYSMRSFDVKPQEYKE